MNETVESILNRRTIRSYTDEPLTEEEIRLLTECAKYAPSGRNGQPLLLRAVTDKSALDELNADFWKTVGEGAKAYTRCETNPVYHGAPVMFFLFSETGAPCAMDAGIMVENIAVAAEGMGLGSVIIGSVGALFDGEFASKWKEKMLVPQADPFMIAVAVGHKAENPAPKPRKDENYVIL